ncbi:MAG TPA: branched-chain amino acid ABC transporter permease [Burkholderiaceae bacterium]|nr:branched-chain amino acid ABC transporter permease [Burkholderiaceae bacterium]HQR76682.1 branched-chain amino acid ABC transporter permease [Burkholderiaceae bacterium]
MNFDIALLLAQDGITNGAVYALLALALVLAFAVTRVIFIPQGEFVAYGALTLVAVQAGRLPGTVKLLLVAGALVALIELVSALRTRQWRQFGWVVLWNLVYPLALWALLRSMPATNWPMPVQILVALAIVVPLGPMVYRLAYQPIAEAPVLNLLIVSVAVHVVMLGLGLLMFGAEGSRTPPFSEGTVQFGALSASAQSLWVIGCSLGLIALLYFLFERTVYGKALRATAVNRRGAKLMGIPTEFAGRLSFFLCALIGAFSGILIAPITTIYYDTGFLMGLKGFVGAIIGGLASYPIAAAGALLVGLLESFSSFWASAYKEVIVFTLIIPVLLWRSLRAHHVEEDE